MGAKDRIFTNWLLNKTFSWSSAPLTWVISKFNKFNIGKVLAVVILIFYSVPLLSVLMTLSLIANILDSLVALIKYK